MKQGNNRGVWLLAAAALVAGLIGFDQMQKGGDEVRPEPVAGPAGSVAGEPDSAAAEATEGREKPEESRHAPNAGGRQAM